MKVRFKKLAPDAVMPSKAHPTDAGFDLTATSLRLDEDGCITYGFGLSLEIPKGYVGLIFPRSSIAKKDLMLTNAVGVIDSGYRGEVKAKFKPAMVFDDFYGEIKATFPDDYTRIYEAGQKIAQIIIMPYPEVEFEEADELSDSDRGEGGFGSTGK